MEFLIGAGKSFVFVIVTLAILFAAVVVAIHYGRFVLYVINRLTRDPYEFAEWTHENNFLYYDGHWTLKDGAATIHYTTKQLYTIWKSQKK